MTVTHEVSKDNGATWVSSGDDYTKLINSATNGALKIIPDIAEFVSDAEVSRKVRVTYKNTANPAKEIKDDFEVIVQPKKKIVELANSQYHTLVG